MANVGCFGAVSTSEERLVLTLCKGKGCGSFFLNLKTGQVINHMQPIWTSANPQLSWHAQDTYTYSMLQSARHQATHAVRV